MKLFLTLVLGFSLSAVIAQAAPAKRKIAQQKVECVPLGVAFDPYKDADSISYSADEFNYLKNSIYAQVGMKFKSEKLNVEMKKRGCAKDGEYSPDLLQKVDKQNISSLKVLEKSLRESEAEKDFGGPWEKAAKSARTRTKLLAYQYCYLSDAAGKYFGMIFFGDEKQGNTRILNGMMDIDKPTWADRDPEDKPMTEAELKEYQIAVAQKQIDSSSVNVLNFETKGTWAMSTNMGLAELKVSIYSSYKNVKDAAVKVSYGRYADMKMLDCQLAN